LLDVGDIRGCEANFSAHGGGEQTVAVGRCEFDRAAAHRRRDVDDFLDGSCESTQVTGGARRGAADR
jgi:hypothetical protein